MSDTARRLTNLFEAPEPIQVGQRIYDNKHIHRSRRGELMISKSEVIIANELAAAGIVYEYERPFTGTWMEHQDTPTSRLRTLIRGSLGIGSTSACSAMPNTMKSGRQS